MPDQPVIAVFADSAVAGEYLAGLAVLAGGASVRIGKAPVEASLVLAAGPKADLVPRHPAQPMLWLGEGRQQVYVS
jgi:hypothetical protein